MSTRRTAQATTDNEVGPVRTTRSTAKVSGSSPDSKKGSSKKKGTNARSSKSASTDSSNMQKFMDLTPEEKELMEMVKRSATNKVDTFESPSKKEKSKDAEEEASEAEGDDENEYSDTAEEKETMEIVQTQLIPSVGKDSGTKSLDKTLEVHQQENESEAALEGIGALEDISEVGASPQGKAGGNNTQFMESQELTGLASRFTPKMPAIDSQSEKAESVKSDMLNNINSLAEIDEEKTKEIDQEVEKELAVGTVEGDMGTFNDDEENNKSDEGDRVIMPNEESKDRMEEEQEQDIQKKKELEDKQLEEDREMIENATNVEVAPARSDDSGETVEVIKPEITKHSQEATVLFDDKTPKSSVQRGNLGDEIARNEEAAVAEEVIEPSQPQPQPNQDFTGELEDQDVFDKFIIESEDIEEEKKAEIPAAQEVYNITQEEILQNYRFNRRSRRRNQLRGQESDDDEEEEQKEEIYEPSEEVKSATVKEKAGSGHARKEYAVYEDWRILESLAAFERQNGSVGLKSINTWTALRDPLTKKKLTEMGRTAESLKTRMYKTLALLTEQDKKQIAEYIKNHSKEEAMSAYCRFDVDKATKKKKKFQGIFKEQSHPIPTNFQRKAAENQKPERVEVKQREKARLPGLVERAFEEQSDDIEDVMDFIEEPRESIFNPDLPIISEVLDFSVEKINPVTKPAGKPIIFAPIQGNSKSNGNINNIKPIERVEEQNSRASMVSSTRTVDKQKINKKRKDYRMVSYPVAARQTEMMEEIGYCLKRVKDNQHFEQRSLLISDEFKIKISTEKFNAPQTDINVFVDADNNFRQFVIVEDSQDVEDHFNQNLIIERLSQIASKYKIRQEDVHNLFQAVSNDFDDLQLYLKTKNPFILWEPSEDQDLLGGDQTAIRYLLQLKGEERIARRRQYLMGE